MGRSCAVELVYRVRVRCGTASGTRQTLSLVRRRGVSQAVLGGGFSGLAVTVLFTVAITLGDAS